MQEFDLAIIGGGIAGYTAAIRASKFGLTTCCIEQEDRLGGTCLNVGCIPSKALLNFAQKYSDIKNNKYSEIGLKTDHIDLDLSKMISKKDSIIAELEKGIRFLLKQNKVTLFNAKANIIDETTLELNEGKKNAIIKAKNTIIATGSKVRTLQELPLDGKFIISSSEALSMNKIPSNIVILGGGYIGLELGSLYNRLGSKVTIVESTKNIASAVDQDITKILYNSLVKQGIEFIFDAKIEKSKIIDSSIEIQLKLSEEKIIQIKSEQILVSVGRVSNTDCLRNSSIMLKTNDRGSIIVNQNYQTNIPNIYAIGDVIGGFMLAHKAEHEALEVVENIIHKEKPYSKKLKIIPSVIYTNPEVATIGYSESELKSQGIAYKIGKSYFKSNGRAHTMLSKEGLVKILVSDKYHKILGASIVGQEAGTLVAELVAYMEFQASAEDIALTIHAHPSLNEAIKEAANQLL